MNLRSYQIQAVQSIKSSLKIKKTFLLAAPCAAGKTVIFCEIAKWIANVGKSCLVLIDREKLVSQTADRIREYLDNPFPDPVGIVCATAGYREHNSITVASRQTFINYLRDCPDLKFNLLILDEAHLVNQQFGQYFEIINELQTRYPNMRILGCTATPYRILGEIYGDGKLFDLLDHKITTAELQAQNFLTPLLWKVRREDKLDICRITGNDINEAEQYEIVSQKYFIQSVYDVWEEFCQNRKTVIFALNIAHAEAIFAKFAEINTTKVQVIHSKQPKSEIDAKINRNWQVMINVGILTIGSDIPSITAIILARRTVSTGLFFQIVGRGSRIHPGKTDCLIIDLGGSAFFHGTDPDNPEIFTRKNQDEPKFKLCPECEQIIKYDVKFCPHCKFEFPKDPSESRQSSESEAGDVVNYEDSETVVCDRITYAYHSSGKPLPTVRASFWDDEHSRKLATHWFCPEHDGFLKQIADDYWREMWGSEPPPNSVEEWLYRASELSPVAEITLEYKGKYPKIIELKNNLF